MIFETKQYHLAKQYKINGAVVRKSIFEDVQKLYEKNELLKANNQDRKKLIDEILTAIQDREVITGGMLEDWGQCEYGISHRTEAKG